MSKFLVFSDLHLHNWNYGANHSNGWNSRLFAQKNVLNQIDQYCVDNDIQSIFFCGDLFHTHGKIDAACLTVASQFFSKLERHAVNSVILTGNHDMSHKETNIVDSVRWLNGYKKNILVGDYIQNFPMNGINFTAVSYTEDKEKLKIILSRVPEGNFVFLHQGVSGVPVGSDFVIPNEVLEPSMIPAHVKHVFTGHYHNHKKINDKLTIVGAPIQHTWADSGEDKGWLVVDSETGEYERVLSNAPKFVKIGGVYPTKDVPGNYIRIEEFVKERDKEELRKHFIDSGALSVEFSYKSTGPNTKFGPVKDFNLNDVIERFHEAHGLDDKAIKTGEDLRHGTYETNLP